MRKLARPNRRGSADYAALIFISAVLIIGCVVGLATLRDSIVQEFGDVGTALVNIDQSYDVSIDVDGDDVPDFQASYDDVSQSAFGTPVLTDPAGAPPAGLQFDTTPNTDE